MKKLIFLLIAVSFSVASQAQSDSYQALRNHFFYKPDVHAFSMSGLLCRMAVGFMVPEESVLRQAMRDIKHIRFMVIPKEEFTRQQLSVKGFRQVLQKDGFEMLAHVRDNGDDVSFLLREEGKDKKKRYFVLIEESDEVVAIEMKGFIDPEIFKDEKNKIALNY
ncbi:MAG: DUF4252 domain-containing protein [Cyclobacteriaceae bacterium]